MLIGTALFIMVGSLGFLVLEWDGVLIKMPLWQRLLVSFFHSVTCRTAGFNTVELSNLTNATLFMSILLMAIGAGPCSTGGGFKVSTFMVLVFQALSTFRGHRRLSLFRRTIPQTIIDRATATAMLFTDRGGCGTDDTVNHGTIYGTPYGDGQRLSGCILRSCFGTGHGGAQHWNHSQTDGGGQIGHHLADVSRTSRADLGVSGTFVERARRKRPVSG